MFCFFLECLKSQIEGSSIYSFVASRGCQTVDTLFFVPKHKEIKKIMERELKSKQLCLLFATVYQYLFCCLLFCNFAVAIVLVFYFVL